MIVTDQGEFSNFAELRFAYLLAMNGNPSIQQYFRQDEWNKNTLHISELGKCPRKQMLRLMGAAERPRTIAALANDELMFWQGNIIHALTVGACDWAGIMLSYEESLPNLPDGWSGHYDLIWNDRSCGAVTCWDGKTVRPNAFNWWYTWPKPEERAQMKGYLHFLTEAHYGEIEHIDRGGSNPPRISTIIRDDHWVEKQMHWLENLRAELSNYGTLPDPLDWDYDLSYRKVTNENLYLINKIWYKPNWQCEWCDYLHGYKDKKTGQWWISDESPCKPDLRPSEEVAKVSKGQLQWLLPNHQAQVEHWIKEQLQSFSKPEDIVE